MRKYWLVLLFIDLALSQIPHVTVPIRINDQSPPQVVSIDINNDSIKYRLDHVIDTTNKTRDTVNYYLNSSGGFTGTGKIVKQASPTLTGTAAIAAAAFSGTLTLNGSSVNNGTMTNNGTISGGVLSGNTLSGTITNSGTISGGTGNFTTLQQGGVQAVTTSGTQTLTNKSIVASQITPGTFPSGNYGIQGDFTFSNPSNAAGTFRGVSGTIADNDYWYIGGRVASGSNDGQVYIGSGDDGNEPIVFGTGTTSSPTVWGYFNNNEFSSNIGIFDLSGQVRSVNSGANGTYLELAKYASALPGYPTSYLPTLKTDHHSIFFSVSGKFTGGVDNVSGLNNELFVMNEDASATDVSLKTNGQSSFIRTGKLGIGNNAPDSVLSVTGSGKVTGNMEVGGAIGAASFRSNSGSFYWDTTISLTWSGFVTGGLGKLRFIKIGKMVTMEIDTIQSGTGATGAGVSKSSIVPTSLRPAQKVEIPVSPNNCIENSGFGTGFFGEISTGGTVTLTPFYNDHTIGDEWVDGGTRGLDCRISTSWMIP